MHFLDEVQSSDDATGVLKMWNDNDDAQDLLRGQTGSLGKILKRTGLSKLKRGNSRSVDVAKLTCSPASSSSPFSPISSTNDSSAYVHSDAAALIGEI